MKSLQTIAFLFMLTAVSCHPGTGSGVSVVGDDLAKADVRRQDALTHLVAAKPGCSPTAAVHVESAAADLTNQGGDLKQAQTDLKTVQANYDREEKAYTTLAANPWVKAALFLQKLFYWVLGLAVAGFIAVTAAIVFLPAGSGISMFLIRLFPLMNFATNLRNWYQGVKMIPLAVAPKVT